MKNLSLTTVGAICAVLMVVTFVVGITLMATSGVQVLIPETGDEGREWIADVNDASGAFIAGAWLTILGGYLGMIALVGFYDALRGAGRVLIIAGNFLGWGVAIPMIAYAILKTAVVPRWIGWLGIVVAVFALWLGLLGPASSLLEGISSIGFLAFFVFMLSMGIALLRRGRPREGLTPVATS